MITLEDAQEEAKSGLRLRVELVVTEVRRANIQDPV